MATAPKRTGGADDNARSDELVEKWMKQIKELYGDKYADEFQKESSAIRKYLPILLKDLQTNYVIDGPFRIGGSGLVFKAHHKRIQQEFAVKFNRPLTSGIGKTMVEKERRILPTLDHPGIIRVVDVGSNDSVDPPLSYIVEPFIANPRSLQEVVDSYASQLSKVSRTDLRLGTKTEIVKEEIPPIKEILVDIAKFLLQWVEAINYLHGKRILYLDLKPTNAIVDSFGRLFLIDFGSVVEQPSSSNEDEAKDVSSGLIGYQQSESHLRAYDGNGDGNEPVEVACTRDFAHPEILKQKHREWDSNRLTLSMKRSDLRPAMDYYALGRSILKLLDVVADAKPNDCPQLSLFRSIHFIATRLLDGENDEHSKAFKHVKEVFGQLRKEEYETIRYRDLESVATDLKKELGLWNPELEVPELATYSRDVVRVVPGLNTALTPRLRDLLEHPILARLKFTSQLGLATLVYPTADHSRYEHVLGTFTYTVNYVKSLFNDGQNPIFRNLVGAEEIKTTILAGLIHDLGQYPLAHDLEEVLPQVFGHTTLSLQLIDSPTPDTKGRTLGEIITDGKVGWGVDITLLKKILGGAQQHGVDLDQREQVRNFKVDMLSALIDGPIDADKADYITRDSIQCRTPYGSQLDIERLMRVLTIAVVNRPDSPYRTTVGVYEKGKASAEAFGLARYLLFSSVYWHHTLRILKSMLQYGTALGIPDDVFNSPDLKTGKALRQGLMSFVTNLTPPFETSGKGFSDESEGKIDLAKPPPKEAVEVLQKPQRRQKRSGKDEFPWYPGISWTDWLMLRWLTLNLPRKDRRSTLLFESIANRNLYKRLVTYNVAEDSGFVGRFENLAHQWPKRVQLCETIQKRLEEILFSKEPELTQSIGNKTDIERVFDRNLAILVDIPSPKEKKGHRLNRPLMIVPELKEKAYFQEVDEPYTVEVPSEAMMESIAPIRLLCHPDLLLPISASFEPGKKHVAIKTVVSEALDEL